MRKRTLKSYQRKSKNLVPYYCTGCGMLLLVDKSLCSGCKEAKRIEEGFEKFLKSIQKRQVKEIETQKSD